MHKKNYIRKKESYFLKYVCLFFMINLRGKIGGSQIIWIKGKYDENKESWNES